MNSSKLKKNGWWTCQKFARVGIFLDWKKTSLCNNSVFRMILSYLKIAYRNMARYKGFFFINIFSLVTGVASCLFILQFLIYELRFDSFHDNSERIYRIINDRYQHGQRVHHSAATYPPLGPAIAQEFTEVEQHTRFMLGFGPLNVKIGDDLFYGGTHLYADREFLNLFTFPLIAGNKATALKDPYSIVISASKAATYFSSSINKDYDFLLGKSLYIGLEKQPYVITGVCQDVPMGSHLQFDALISYTTLVQKFPIAEDSWTWSDMRHYILLKDGADPKVFETKLEEFTERHFQGEKRTGSVEKFYLQNLNDIHLYSDIQYDLAETTDGRIVWGLVVISGFILVIALINYITFVTSRSADRIKEIGIRKVVGSVRSQLIIQFTTESLVIFTIGTSIALIVVLALQRHFNFLLGINLDLLKTLSLASPSMLLMVATLLFAVVAFGSLYPAVMLSSSQPVAALKGTPGKSASVLNTGLIIFQFAIASALVIATEIVSGQLTFVNQADLGLQVKQMLVINPPERTAWDSTFVERINTFKHEVRNINGVSSVATSGSVPGQKLPRIFNIYLKDKPSENHFTMSAMGVGPDFFSNYNIPMLAGRDFVSTDYSLKWSNITSLIINETACRVLGFTAPPDAIGREIFIENRFFTVVGVISDFHQESMKRPKEPMLLRPVIGSKQYISVKLDDAATPSSIASIEGVFKNIFYGNSFNYYYLEDSISGLYSDDKRFSYIIRIFSILTIIVSCFGLIGLSVYTVMKRTKEIGIRKILGSGGFSTIVLLSSGFVRLVAIGIVLSIPITYLLMLKWLEGYAYHIELDWFRFVLPGAGIIVLAIVTISVQVIKTAMMSPIKSLKHE